MTFAAAVCYLASLPGVAALRIFKCRRAAALASSAVFVNPPTFIVLSVVVSEVYALATGSVGRLFSVLFKFAERSENK